jgi:hypothetical protein
MVTDRDGDRFVMKFELSFFCVHDGFFGLDRLRNDDYCFEASLDLISVSS